MKKGLVLPKTLPLRSMDCTSAPFCLAEATTKGSLTYTIYTLNSIDCSRLPLVVAEVRQNVIM